VKTILFSLAFFVLYGFHATAQDTSDAAIQSKIVALEKAWNQAYKAGDTKALDELLDNSIVLINDDGSVQSKADFLSSVHATNSQEQQVAPESMHVHVFGNVAVASGVMRVKGVENGKSYTRRERSWIRGFSRLGNGCASRPTLRPSCANSASSTRKRVRAQPCEARFATRNSELTGVAIVPPTARRCLFAEVHKGGYSQQDDREDPEGRIAHSSFLSHAAILPPIQH